MGIFRHSPGYFSLLSSVCFCQLAVAAFKLPLSAAVCLFSPESYIDFACFIPKVDQGVDDSI